MTTIDDFNIIGISVRTTNRDGRALQEIGKLWGRFYADKLFERIPDRLSDDIYSIYTDYKSDYQEDYTVIIGLKVASLEVIPNGLTGRHFSSETFTQFAAKGKMPQAIMDIWSMIWSRDGELKRKYSYDFEVYGDKSQKGADSEVSIYVATRP